MAMGIRFPARPRGFHADELILNHFEESLHGLYKTIYATEKVFRSLVLTIVPRNMCR
jgi:hypothetical protein